MKAKDWDLPEIPAKMPKEKKSEQGVLGSDKRLYLDLQQIREDDWRKAVLAFECNPNVHNAYWYVAQHPMFYYFTDAWKDARAPRIHERHLVHDQGWDGVHIIPVMVNPDDNRISDDVHLNTKVQFWWEFGPTLFRENGGSGVRGHDHHCDGGADTYDEAIIGVAKKIHEVYGNDRRQVMKQWKDPILPEEASQ